MAFKKAHRKPMIYLKGPRVFALLLKGLMHHCFEVLSGSRECINGQRLEIERRGFQTWGSSKVTKSYLGSKRK